MALTVKGNTTVLESYGVLTTDRYGLSTATATWFDASGNSPTATMPRLGENHPLWTDLQCEGVVVTHEGGRYRIEGKYAGVFGEVLPVYELCESMSEEPIETHPDFESFATEANGYYPNEDDGSFVGFIRMPKWDRALDVPTPRTVTNPTWVGVRAYLVPGATYRKTWVTDRTPEVGSLGAIESPSGAPTYSGRTWLYTGMTYEQRGRCYVTREEWRLSGPLGWNATIYTG